MFQPNSNSPQMNFETLMARSLLNTTNNSLRSSTAHSLLAEDKTQLLPKYRTLKANEDMKIKMKQVDKKESFLPEILCRIFMDESENVKAKEMNSYCECPKSEEGLCMLVLNWIDQTYFWKTDPQFRRTYEHYARKKNDEFSLLEMNGRIRSKLEILGFELDEEKVQSLSSILLNYQKHSEYYGKTNLHLRDSDIYIWVGLGLSYHIGLGKEHSHPEIIFWALHIVVDKIGALTTAAFQGHHQQAMKHFNYYFKRWVEFLSGRGIQLEKIVWEWMNEMMFGYMGIESICFFVDCLMKVGWEYLYKICLSYFDHRVNDLRRDSSFLSGEISNEEILCSLLNGKEEWPMVFCTASSFACKEEH